MNKDAIRGISNDHVVFIAFGSMEILGCVKSYEMSFSRRAVECCVGEWFVLDSVAEVCKVEEKSEEPSTARTRKPINSKNHKRQREKKGDAKRISKTIC